MDPTPVRLSRMRVAAMAAWRRYLRTRKLPAYWPELAMLDPVERAAVKAILRDRCVWIACERARINARAA